jgi:SAM-dependent methyltransferase
LELSVFLRLKRHVSLSVVCDLNYELATNIAKRISVFLTQVIRREVDFIKQVHEAEKPRLVLHYVCGGGWLSRLMCKWGFEVVGIDLSKRLVRFSKSMCREGDFVVCDAMRLPFRICDFDFIVGISIFHYLPKLSMALSELKRVSASRTVYLFMESNALNPLSAFGRRFLSTEAHTNGEKPFIHEHLKAAFCLAGFMVEKYFALFLSPFLLHAYLKVAKITLSSQVVKLLFLF